MKKRHRFKSVIIL